METLIRYIEKYRHDERVPVSIIGIVGFLFLIYFYDWIGDFRYAPPKMAPTTIIPSAPITPISEWHLFGIYQNHLQDLPETSLALTLQGIMLDLTNQKNSYVIITSPSTPPHVYKIGEALPGGATLAKILQQQIIINNQGISQSLRLPIDQLE